MSDVGFTGTRKGLPPAQWSTLLGTLTHLRKTHDTFRHGDCVGADAQAALLAIRLDYRLIAHPMTPFTHRAFIPASAVMRPLPPLDRNRNIVDNSDVMVACPGGMHEELRSGTWATIRYARKVGRPLLVVWPDGVLEQERV